MSSNADAPRLLALHSEIGYVDRLDRALPDEPEAVTEAEQHAITQQVHRDKQRRDHDEWVVGRDEIRRVLLIFDTPAYATLAQDIRALRRIVERIDGRLKT